MSLFDDVKRLLPLADAGTKHDALIETMIQRTKAQAYQYMHVSLDSVVGEQITLDGGKPVIYLPHLNVTTAVVAVEDTTLVADDEYYLYPERGIIRAPEGGVIGSTRRDTVVTYNGGYAEDDLPESFKRALCKQVSYEFRRRTDPGLAAVSYPDGMVQKMIVDEWLPDVKAEFDRYRRITL